MNDLELQHNREQVLPEAPALPSPSSSVATAFDPASPPPSTGVGGKVDLPEPLDGQQSTPQMPVMQFEIDLPDDEPESLDVGSTPQVAAPGPQAASPDPQANAPQQASPRVASPKEAEGMRAALHDLANAPQDTKIGAQVKAMAEEIGQRGYPYAYEAYRVAGYDQGAKLMKNAQEIQADPDLSQKAVQSVNRLVEAIAEKKPNAASFATVITSPAVAAIVNAADTLRTDSKAAIHNKPPLLTDVLAALDAAIDQDKVTNSEEVRGFISEAFEQGSKSNFDHWLKTDQQIELPKPVVPAASLPQQSALASLREPVATALQEGKFKSPELVSAVKQGLESNSWAHLTISQASATLKEVLPSEAQRNFLKLAKAANLIAEFPSRMTKTTASLEISKIKAANPEKAAAISDELRAKAGAPTPSSPGAAGHPPRRQFDPNETVSPTSKYIPKVQDLANSKSNAELQSLPVSAALIAKLNALKEGQQPTFTKGEMKELRTSKLIDLEDQPKETVVA